MGKTGASTLTSTECGNESVKCKVLLNFPIVYRNKQITFLKRLQILKQEWQEKPSWDQANRRQKLGLVWRIRKNISQIIKDYFCLPFFLLIIL